jgi:hypothetical protein
MRAGDFADMLVGVGEVEVGFGELGVEFDGELMFADSLRHAVGLAVTDSEEVMKAGVIEAE